MDSEWFQALQEADPEAAMALSGAEDVSAEPFVVMPDAGETARAWLTAQAACPNVVILPGAGQSDLIEPLLQLKETITILLLDRNAARLKFCLNAVGGTAIAAAIRSRRLLIDTGEAELQSIERFLNAADFSRVPRIRLLDARPVTDEDFLMATEMTKAARDLLRFQACDLSTRLRFGTAWQSQTVRNIPNIIKHAGIKTLFNQFRGLPALVIGAGPSLNTALPYIKALRGRFVVICVGRVVSHLHRNQLNPDLIVTGDGQSIVKNHFKMKSAGTPVAASCFTDPDVIQELDRVFFMEMVSMRLPNWMHAKLGEQGEIYPGGNVSTAAMSVAVSLGCNPVLTAGFDLSYPEDGKTHAADQVGKNFRAGGTYYDVPGNYQPTVKTNRQMFHYIDFANEFMADHPETTFVNINTAGARIEKMQLARPEEMETFAGDEINAAKRFSDIYEQNAADPVLAERCRNALREDLPSLQSLRTQCLGAAMVCNQMIMLMRRPGRVKDPEAALRAYLEQIRPVDERLKNDPVMDLLEARLEAATHALTGRMVAAEVHEISPAVRSHRRWRDFYEEVAAACLSSQTLIEEVIDRIEVSLSLAEDAVCNETPMEVAV